MKGRRMCRLISGMGGLLLILTLVGCLGGQSPSVDYYGLASLEQIDSDAAASNRLNIALGVGPVTVPYYLKKSQIATRLEGNRYRFDEFHRWAGVIEKDLSSVIGNNLGLLLGTDEVMFFPWMHYFKPDYRVVIEIIQFDSALNGDAVLSTRWAIIDGAGVTTLSSGKSDYRHALDSPSYEALINAESLLLATFTRELAGELRALTTQE